MDSKKELKKPEEMMPNEWLAHLRRKHGLIGNFSTSTEELEDLLQRIPESHRDVARKIWQSRYQISKSEIHDELMEQYLDEVKPALNPKEFGVVNSTFFGLMPTAKFNGYAGFSPRGDRVVILHEGLGYTLSFWSHWHLRSLIDEGGLDYLGSNPISLINAFIHILQCWYGYKPDLTKRPDIYPKSVDAWELSQCMTLAAISFVLGHEIGHILKDHKGYTSNVAVNHAQEYEADRIGLSITVRHALLKSACLQKDNYFDKLMLFGPLFALGVMSLFGDHSSKTHPSPSQRRLKLLKSYEDEFKTIFDDKHLSEINEDLFNILTRNSSNLFILFERYRNIMDKVEIGTRAVDNSWVHSELRTIRPNK